MAKEKNKLAILLIISILIIGTFYKYHNPYEGGVPKCYFHTLTGYKCPGCGSQRALHYLLNFQLKKAMEENALLLLFLPIFALYILSYFNIINYRIQNFFNSIVFVYVSIVAVLFFWIFRNILNF